MQTTQARGGSRLAMSAVALVAVFSLVLAGCGSKGSDNASGAGASQTTTGQTCSQVGSVKLAKTKFLFHGGLAFGAFHRYLYKPFKSGNFKSGADGRVKALIKGGAAALFVLHELKYVKKDAEADKTLCKLVAPLDKATGTLSGLAGKLKSGKASDDDVNQLGGVSDALESFKSDAGKNGANIKDKTPPGNLATSDSN